MARIKRPPPFGTKSQNVWLGQFTDAFNKLPPLSVDSFTSHANDSALTAAQGTLLFNQSSSATTLLWFKQSGSTTTGWKAVTLT